MKKLITLLLATSMCLTLGLTLTACDSPNNGQQHTHDYGKTICFDDQNHWVECSCGDKKDVEAHKGGSATCTKKAECSVCGEEYGDLGAHEYTTLKHNETEHWYECVCGDKSGVEAHKGGSATCTKKAECSVCEEEYGDLGAHEYTTLKHNETEHWYECVCGDKSGVEAHKGGSATCTKKAECSVCEEEYGDLGAHDYATEWSVDDQKHWKECREENCQAIKDEGEHVYINGVCVCGKEALVQDGSVVTKTQWENAFALENVTINQYDIVENEQNLQTKMLLDGNVAAVQMGEDVFILPEGYADVIRMPFGLSQYFEQAQYQDGTYTLSNIDMFGDESYVYNSASLIFEDGVLKSLSATVTEEVEDETGEFVKGTFEYYFEFEDYGTTEVALPSLPLTQGEWEAAFAIENLENATVTTTLSGVYQQYSFANDKQRITATTMYVTLDIYCVDSIWYNYDQATGTHSLLSPTDPIYPGTIMKESLADMFSIMVETYTYMTYDEGSDMYVFTVEGAGGYSIKITDGKVSQINVINFIEGVMDVQTYTFSNYGTTTITVPFVIE